MVASWALSETGLQRVSSKPTEIYDIRASRHKWRVIVNTLWNKVFTLDQTRLSTEKRDMPELGLTSLSGDEFCRPEHLEIRDEIADNHACRALMLLGSRQPGLAG